MMVMMVAKTKVEYEDCGVRVCSKTIFNDFKLNKVSWIEIWSYDRARWEKFREISPVPKGAVIKHIYEYGNGILVAPFWDRVTEKMDKIKTEYNVIQSYDRFVPSHYCYTNCFGMEVYQADELYRILILKKKFFKTK